MIIGAILAGGNSTRFGTDKSFYNLDGRPMYQHVWNHLKDSGVCDRIVVNTNNRLKDEFYPLETIVDDEHYKDHGPLGGLYALLNIYPHALMLVVSTDTPYVPSDWLKTLVTVAQDTNKTVVTKGEQLHPLIGVYQGKHIVADLKKQLESKKLSIRQFLKHHDYTILNIDDYGLEETMFRNINHKTDIL